jgi:hypothetical protein
VDGLAVLVLDEVFVVVRLVVLIVVEGLLVVFVLEAVAEVVVNPMPVSLVVGIAVVVKVVFDQVNEVVSVVELDGCGFGGFPGIMPPGVVCVVPVEPSQYATHPFSVIFFMTVLNPVIPTDEQDTLFSSFVIVGGLATYSMWYTGFPDLIKLL